MLFNRSKAEENEILSFEKQLLTPEHSKKQQALILEFLSHLIEEIKDKYHVIILNGWWGYQKAIDYLKTLDKPKIIYCGDNDLPDPDKPKDIPRGDFILQELKNNFRLAVLDMRPRYANYKDLNAKLMNEKSHTVKTY